MGKNGIIVFLEEGLRTGKKRGYNKHPYFQSYLWGTALSDCLLDRMARVRFPRHYANFRVFENGTPQGEILTAVLLKRYCRPRNSAPRERVRGAPHSQSVLLHYSGKPLPWGLLLRGGVGTPDASCAPHWYPYYYLNYD